MLLKQVDQEIANSITGEDELEAKNLWIRSHSRGNLSKEDT